MNKKSFLILPALLSALIIVIGYLASQQINELRNLKSELATIIQSEGQVEAWQKTVALLGGDRQIVQNYFVTVETLPAFIAELESLAAATKVDFNLMAASPIASLTGAAETARLSFSAVGIFPKLFQFFSALGVMPHALRVTQATLVEQKAGNWNGVFTIDLFSE